MKDYLLPALLVLGVVAIVGVRIMHHTSTEAPPSSVSPVSPLTLSTPAAPPQAPAPPASAAPQTPPAANDLQPAPTPSNTTPSQAPSPATPSPARPAKNPKPAKAKLPDPPAVQAARTALASVGEDPEAEAVWMDTINDPSTPAEARNDLIEDLNQDGFPDPKNLTADDLPLIESRIALVEQLGPNAMDDTNSAAFQEAYKDLLHMEAKLLGPIP